MYGDETISWFFDGLDGHVIFMQPRTSGTLIEYPSVADVDNDGSADILLVSNRSTDSVLEELATSRPSTSALNRGALGVPDGRGR